MEVSVLMSRSSILPSSNLKLFPFQEFITSHGKSCSASSCLNGQTFFYVNKEQKTARKAVLALLLTDIGKRLVENFDSPRQWHGFDVARCTKRKHHVVTNLLSWYWRNLIYRMWMWLSVCPITFHSTFLLFLPAGNNFSFCLPGPSHSIWFKLCTFAWFRLSPCLCNRTSLL